MAEWSQIARRIRVPLGFLFAVFYFWLARPTWRSMALGAIVVVPGLLIRALASGHVRKNESLATSGPYAYTRNPLYLGSLLIGLGFCVAARSWWVGVVLVVMFFAIYLPVIRDEETLPADEHFLSSRSMRGGCRGCCRGSAGIQVTRRSLRRDFPGICIGSTASTMRCWERRG